MKDAFEECCAEKGGGTNSAAPAAASRAARRAPLLHVASEAALSKSMQKKQLVHSRRLPLPPYLPFHALPLPRDLQVAEAKVGVRAGALEAEGARRLQLEVRHVARRRAVKL